MSPDGEGHDKPLYSPVAYQHYSSLFKPRRFHPIKKRRQAHLGLDFELPAGHAVYTVQSGRVLRTGKNRAAGNFVVVRHQSGLESYYNHLQSISPEVKKGRQVFNGQKLGTIGCTGYCTKAVCRAIRMACRTACWKTTTSRRWPPVRGSGTA